jgi:hypothetical protein
VSRASRSTRPKTRASPIEHTVRGPLPRPVGAVPGAWERGRYFFTVRNALYTSYKFGIPLPRLVLGAAAFLVRGLFNGVGGSALRGTRAAIGLCVAYTRSSEDKRLYRLSPRTWDYIGACERGDVSPP